MKKALFLRTCDRDGRSYDGFQWPESGIVRPEKWVPDKCCGGGLHGLLWGEGNSSALSQDSSAVWIVFEADLDMAVDLDGEWKVPEATVVYYGDQEGATQYLYTHGGRGHAIHGIALTGGFDARLAGGDFSTVVGGYGSIVTGGYGSTVTGGHRSTVTGGFFSTVTGGDGSTVTGGGRSTVTGGCGSTVAGGKNSILMLRWWDNRSERYRVEIAYVGENGIEPDVPYRLDKEHKFTRA